MSDEELYQLAQKRIDRNTQRILLLGVNFFAFLLFVAAFAGLGIVPSNVGKFVAIAWMGVIILHVILLFVMQYRKEAIEGEVENLRREIYGEKPKRLELGEDGELVDVHFEADLEPTHKRRGDSV